MVDDPQQAKATARKWRRRAIILGVLLGVACKALPSDYQAVCEAVVSVCTGGF